MATCIMATMTVMSVAVKQFKRNNLHELILEANVSRDLQSSDIMTISLTSAE